MNAPSPQSTPAAPKRFMDISSEADGLAIRVFPLSFRELENHAEEIAQIFRSVSVVVGSGQALNAGNLWTLLSPAAGRQLLRLVDACCTPSLNEARAPWELTVQAVAAWAELSFFNSGSVEKAVASIESMLSAATGERIDLRTPFASLFTPATLSATSTPASDSTATPAYADGPPANSSTDSPPPVALKVPAGLVPLPT